MEIIYLIALVVIIWDYLVPALLSLHSIYYVAKHDLGKLAEVTVLDAIVNLLILPIVEIGISIIPIMNICWIRHVDEEAQTDRYTWYKPLTSFIFKNRVIYTKHKM